ncbi:MAG TPA: universal stress protein [Burkholderiaceae bacterium]
MYKRILVPIDGSDTARRGLKEAIALATEQKVTLRLLHVTSDFPVMLEMANTLNFDKVREGLHQYGRDQLENAKTLAQGLGLEVETQLRDLKGGRVAESVLRASPVPVLLVRAPAVA